MSQTVRLSAEGRKISDVRFAFELSRLRRGVPRGLIELVKGEALTTHQRISEMADPLHFGTWGGMTTKIVWFLFGAMLTALAITGAMIHSLRLKTAYLASEAREARNHGALARFWHGMGIWAYLAGGLVLLSLAMMPGWLSD